MTKNSQYTLHFFIQWVKKIRLNENCAETFVQLGVIYSNIESDEKPECAIEEEQCLRRRNMSL